MNLKEIILNLTPLWVIRRRVRLNPPAASFRTSTGRTFRLLKVTEDFCLAVASEVYDPEITDKLLKMHKEGEALQQAALRGLNNLTTLEKERAFKKPKDLEKVVEISDYWKDKNK